MQSGQASLTVRFRFPTGRGNRVRVVVDGWPAGDLDSRLGVEPGEHAVTVTSWGLPLCGPMAIACGPGESIELDLNVSRGLWLGLLSWMAMTTIGMPLTFILAGPHLGHGPLLALAMLAVAIATCILILYVLLPALSVYTCRLVLKGGATPH